MKIDVMHALKALDERTPHFFKVEALAEDDRGEDSAREIAIATLSTRGDKNVVRLMKEILRIV
jgi:hypothetical protein